jgi:hypothetical protein
MYTFTGGSPSAGRRKKTILPFRKIDYLRERDAQEQNLSANAPIGGQ